MANKKKEIIYTDKKVAQLKPFEDDKLNRESLAENIANIILNTQSSHVFSVNGSWGSGKTYFVDNLIGLMNDSALCIKYNAWESDYYSNPLIPIYCRINEELKSCKDEIVQEYGAIKENIGEVSLNPFFSLGVSAGVTFQVGANIEKGKSITEEYEKLQNFVQRFKGVLSSIQEKIEKPIIIFVDELDRCRPDHAIKTLEIIKHFFQIKNVKFVIAVDKKQIENTVKTMYGCSDEDTGGYLRKFIDLEFNLPVASINEFNLNLIKNTSIQGKILKFNEGNKNVSYNYKDEYFYETPLNLNIVASYFSKVFNDFDFSLRDAEKAIIKSEIIINSMNSSTDIFVPQLLIFLICLNIKNNKEYRSFKEGKYSPVQEWSTVLRSDEYYNWILAIKHYQTIKKLNNRREIDTEWEAINNQIGTIGQYIKCPEQILCYFEKIDFTENFSI